MSEKTANQSDVKEEPSLKEQLAAAERRAMELEIKLRGQEDNTSIPLDAYIEVMSLIPYKLNLSTEKLGRGRQFSFSRFGEVKRILYNDLASIFENYRSFMEQGLFYILNPKVIRKHGLDDVYEKILTKEMIEAILAFNPKSAVKLYKSATTTQQEVIDSMLVKKIVEDPENVDYNIIAQITKIGGRDIKQIAQDASNNLQNTPAQ